MSKFKLINLANSHLFGAALLATTATHGLDPSQAKAASFLSRSNQQLESAKVATGDRHLTSVANDRLFVTSVSTAPDANLLAQATSNEDSEEAKESRTRLLRILSLAFFLLFFVPLGIFYPLFLFYKMLLIKPRNSANGLPGQQKSGVASSINAKNYGSLTASDLTKATVSKLQIAFSPPARELRKELNLVSSVANLKSEDDIVELMHKTIDVLIEQGNWTHISQSSETFPLDRVKPEFDEISTQERHKFNDEQPGLINYNRNVSGSDGYERNYSYVVVTLILCTSHPIPLFKTISTKEQLVEELVKLRRIEENAVIKFELLWNPQQEDIYISNDQLLIEYDEMTRLL